MDIQDFLPFLGSVYSAAIDFFNSPLFLVIKILLGLYTVILFADIVLLVIQKGVKGDMLETLTGMRIPEELTVRKKKLKEKWMLIRQRLQDPTDDNYKLAIIEADNIIDNLISGLGYKGGNMMERLDNIPDSQVPNIEGLRHAHEIRNRIINDESFVLTREEAEHIMIQYEEFLHHFQVLD